MQSMLSMDHPKEAGLVTRKLRLIWKNPESRRYLEVGQFEFLSDGRFAFGYTSAAQDAADFDPLVQFPELHRIYLADGFPSFLTNRVMSRRRPGYDSYLGWLGLGSDAPPVEILARTGGSRATDTFHLVDSFEPSEGRCEGVFFVSGVRYRGCDLRSLHAGQGLELRNEPDNEYNDRAILLTADGLPIGWVPDWLVEDLHQIRQLGSRAEVVIESINLDAPAHLAIRCRMTVS